MTKIQTEILGYSRHPASEVWPNLDKAEYEALRDNMAQQGQDHPIMVANGTVVIDGWHRLMVCDELGFKPVIANMGSMTPAEIAAKIIGAHAGRRHMGKIALARIVVETQAACGLEFAGPGDRHDDNRGQDGPSAITRKGVAAEAQVSERTARRAIAEAKEDRGLTEPRPATPDPDPAPDPDPPAPPAEIVARETMPPRETPPAPPDDAKIIAQLEDELSKERDRAGDLEERLGIVMEAVETPGGEKFVKQLANQRKLIATLKDRVAKGQADLTDQRRTVRALRRKVTSLEKALEKEKAKHATK